MDIEVKNTDETKGDFVHKERTPVFSIEMTNQERKMAGMVITRQAFEKLLQACKTRSGPYFHINLKFTKK